MKVAPQLFINTFFIAEGVNEKRRMSTDISTGKRMLQNSWFRNRRANGEIQGADR